ncbi:hypothetical protein [Ralstonia insidiosa]|uniref:hypothetical protein n=1 Tax=Ralstonia insidiosa TaxID=190721 RepID=UPI000CEEA4FC|nr:hypothetical protein [Ralstonia insidiosa]
MAGNWIKFEVDTPEKPEVLALTVAMGWDDPDLTVGKLLRVWRWFDQQTLEGNAPGVSAALLDRIAGVTGFANAMAKVGWLIVSGDGVSLPNFERHNGETAKSRALTAKRVAKHKANADGNGNGNADGVSDALPKEDKNKEDKKEQKQKTARVAALEPAALVADGVAEQTAIEFLALRRAKGAKLTPGAWDGIKKEAEKAKWPLQDAIAKCLARGWQGFEAAWVKTETQPARASPQAKFDPVAFVNRNRPNQSHDNPDDIIEVEAKPLA